jgi:protein-S-isoprenylcysteine O-methyltransferase Ste14
MRMPMNVVTTGPYRFVRHPIYVANALVGLGIFLMSMSLIVAVGVAAVCVYYALAARSEERFCEQNVPGYVAYAERTGRVFPRLNVSA